MYLKGDGDAAIKQRNIPFPREQRRCFLNKQNKTQGCTMQCATEQYLINVKRVSDKTLRISSSDPNPALECSISTNQHIPHPISVSAWDYEKIT